MNGKLQDFTDPSQNFIGRQPRSLDAIFKPKKCRIDWS